MKPKSTIYLFVAVVFVLSALLSIYAGYSQEETGYIGVEECLKCHPIKKKKKEKTIEKWKDNAHSKLKLGCEACHGPGKEHVELGPKKLTELQKKKGDLKIVVNKKSELCGECHKRSRDNSILLYSDDMIKGNQQYTEMLYNKKVKLKMTCIMCHDAHAGTKSEEGIKRKCLDCHKGKFKVEIKIPAMADLSCESCHMPYANRNSSDTMVKEYHKGDALSHIFGISVDPDYKLNDGKDHVALNEDGFARLTVEMTCYACHKSGEARDMSREEMLEKAEKIH